jgi:hypothetical protein
VRGVRRGRRAGHASKSSAGTWELSGSPRSRVTRWAALTNWPGPTVVVSMTERSEARDANRGTAWRRQRSGAGRITRSLSRRVVPKKQGNLIEGTLWREGVGGFKSAAGNPFLEAVLPERGVHDHPHNAPKAYSAFRGRDGHSSCGTGCAPATARIDLAYRCAQDPLGRLEKSRNRTIAAMK